MREKYDGSKMVPIQTPADRATIEDGLERLTRCVDQTYRVIDRLVDRLDPILLPAIPKDEGSGGKPLGVRSEVGHQIDHLCDEVEDLQVTLRDLTDRVDLPEPPHQPGQTVEF